MYFKKGKQIQRANQPEQARDAGNAERSGTQRVLIENNPV